MSTKLKFTREALSRLSAPANKRSYFYDTAQQGLVLQITPKGVMSFQLYQREGRSVRRHTLGRYASNLPAAYKLPEDITSENVVSYCASLPEINIGMARRLCQLMKAQQKPDVAKEKRQVRSIPTFAQVLAHDLERLEKFARPSTVRNFRNFRKHLETFEPTPVDQLSVGDIETWYERLIDDKSFIIANRALQIANTAFRVAGTGANRLIEGDVPNPFRDIRRNYKTRNRKAAEPKRSRYLQQDEEQDFRDALEKAPRYWKEAIILTLLTGARVSDVESMRWSDIDLENKTWSVPADRASKGGEFKRPLVGPAMEILERRKIDWNDGSGYLFFAHSKSGHVETLSDMFREFIAKPLQAKHPGRDLLTIHRLRATVMTRVVEAGYPETVGKRLLGQSVQGTSAHYLHIGVDVAREALERVIVPIITGRHQEGNVVQLRA